MLYELEQKMGYFKQYLGSFDQWAWAWAKKF